MGREIRRVPPNWEHPKKYQAHFKMGRGLGYEEGYKPLYDEQYDMAADAWIKGLIEWEKNGPRFDKESNRDYWWDNDRYQPQPEDYRHYADSEATWYQVYETVSKGTPVTPPFETLEEIANYLAVNGDFWDQLRGDPAWGFKNADAFCRVGSAFSLVSDKGTILEPKEQATYFEAKAE